MFLGLWELDTMCFDHIRPCSPPAPPRPIQILLTTFGLSFPFFFLHPSSLISPDHKLLTMWTSSSATLMKKTYCPSPSSQTKGGTSYPPPLSMLALGFSQVSCMLSQPLRVHVDGCPAESLLPSITSGSYTLGPR